MTDNNTVIICALTLAAVVCIFALALGYDGAILATVIGALLYVGGYKHRAHRVPNGNV